MRLLLVAAAGASLVVAQSFEVASVKVSGPESERGSDGGPGSSNPGRYSYHRATVEDLIATAYHVDYFQIASRTPLDRERFDLDAKLPAPATREDLRAMLRNVLSERFHLQAHMEKREFAGYELVAAKGGAKIKLSGDLPPAPPNSEYPDLPAGRPGLSSRNSSSGGSVLVRLIGHKQTLAAFADALHAPGGVPVVDRTGLAGRYDFVLEFSYPMPAGASEPAGLPDLMSALPQQLGLRLVSRKIPFDVVVVDAVDRLPSGN